MFGLASLRFQKIPFKMYLPWLNKSPSFLPSVPSPPPFKFMVLSFSLLALPLLAGSAIAHRHTRQEHHHEHDAARQLPDSWYHRDEHPVHSLFRREGSTDGSVYTTVGSSEWTAGFPAGWSTPKNVPDAWTAALKAAVDRKAIPNIPPAGVDPNAPDGDGIPTYAKGYDPNGADVCSATYKCRIPGDIWDAPDGYLALSFDDGPTASSDDLLDFLAANKQAATHFMIGSSLLDNPTQFLRTFAMNDDIAVHTWSHPYMTTLSNEQVVAELGWTMQLIHNSTGGRLPRFWRPPYGDSDMRTRAIAKEVFGLTTVIWNQDTEDWSLTSTPPGTTLSQISESMAQWLKTKSPGLVILEHELSSQSVQAFKSAYPVMKSNDWNVVSLSQLMGNGSAYWNAADNLSAVTPVANILDAAKAVVAQSGTSASASTKTTAGGQAFNKNGPTAESSSPAPSTTGTSGSARSSPAAALITTFFFVALILTL